MENTSYEDQPMRTSLRFCAAWALFISFALIFAGCHQPEKRHKPVHSDRIFNADRFPNVTFAEFNLTADGNTPKTFGFSFTNVDDIAALHHELTHPQTTFEEYRVMGQLSYVNCGFKYTDGSEFHETGYINCFVDRTYLSVSFSDDEGFTGGPHRYIRLDNILRADTLKTLRHEVIQNPEELKTWHKN